MIITLLIASLLVVAGVGLLGGALFGRIRSRRLALLAAAMLVWALAGCMAAGGVTENVSTPAPGNTVVATVADVGHDTPVPTVAPVTPTAQPTATSAATVAAPGQSPLPTPAAPPKAAPSYGQLVFPSQRSGNFDLWIMDLAHPDDLVQLTSNPAADVEPRWSPDGKTVLFSSPEGDQFNDLFVIDADGANRRRLLEWPGSHEWGAAWSPDGQSIAFTSERDGNYQIYILKYGSDEEPVNLTQDGFFNTYPDWSPDGQWLAFVSDRGGNWDIWKLNVADCLAARLSGADADACQPQQLTTNPDDDFFPRWSPDGSRIAFSSRRHADRDIYVMDADGGNVTRLTDSPGNDSNPIWALDGEAIIFSRRPQTNWDIYIMQADGSDVQQLTDFPGQDRFGDWRP